MDEVLLKTENLSKHFGDLRAVQHLNLEVHRGDIYGFLGLNGAGKTTTIRMLVSLIKPSDGRIWFFGKELAKARLKIMANVGALVEVPMFYNYLSGRANLRLLAKTAGLKYYDKYIQLILDWVGLAGRADDKVRAYSQGMRQRLGIAQAIMGQTAKPAAIPIVILDEPTNGLDPQGIVDIRNLIKRLNRENQITFLVSSHLLSEVELLCNRVGIIKQGKMVTQGKIIDLVTTGGEHNLRIFANPADKAMAVLQKLEWVTHLEMHPVTKDIQLKCPPEKFGDVNRYLINNMIEVNELVPVKRRLEDYFISLMK